MKIKQDLLTINQFSRPGIKLLSVKKIVIHYVGNPGTTAKQNVNWVKSLKDQDPTDEVDDTYASAHYFIDDNGIIQVIPEDERAYHVGAKRYTPYGLSISSYPNARTIGIEFCHNKEDGKPSYATYKHIIELCKYLCSEYGLDPMEDITTHNAITGKNCPKYYVDNDNELIKLKEEVKGL